MTFKLPINAHETTDTAGTGDLTLAGAVSGARAFSADLSNGDETIWTLAPNGSSDREVHRGAWNTGGILTRSASTLISSTTGGLINLASGTHDVFVAGSPNRDEHLENLRQYGAFIARNNSAIASPQSVAANTFTKVSNVSLVDEIFDQQGWYDLANARYTPLRPGLYLIGGVAVFESVDNAAKLITAVFKNGSFAAILSRGTVGNTDAAGFGGAVIIEMNGSSDYLELYVYHSSAGARNLNGGSPLYHQFWGAWIGVGP